MGGSKKLYLVVTAVITLLSGCLFDPGSFLGAGSPDSRFDASSQLLSPTSPQVMNSDSFSFLVISDIHYGRYDSALITAQHFYTHTPYDFLIVNGDITQRGLASEWESFERDRVELSVPLYLSIGNHDLFNEGEEQFYHYFGPTHYAFEVGEVLFIFLDTGNGVLSQKAKA